MHEAMDACMHGCMKSWMHAYNILGNFDKYYFSITYKLSMHASMDACMHEAMKATIHACMHALQNQWFTVTAPKFSC